MAVTDPVRVQIAVAGVLQAEVIVQNLWEADRLWERWASLRIKRGEPAGGACFNNVEITRLWNVPIGGKIR